MTVYWVDPYSHNGSNYRGNGTVFNTNRDGSYSSPWNMEDMETAGSKSIDANSEIKIKGLSKTDLFVNLGKFYADGIYYYSMDLRPATNNTNWAANRSSSRYNQYGFIFVIDITESGVPDVSPQQKASDFPFIPTFTWYSSGTGSIEIRYSNTCGFWIATRVAGYNSASNPFPADIWGIKTGFGAANWGNGDDYNLFDNDNIDTVSAGWISDTESSPSGYSLFVTNQSDSNENKYLKGGNNTQFNCSRFFVFNQNREYWNFRPQKNNTTHYFGGALDRTYNSAYSCRVSDQLDNDNKDIVIHLAGTEGDYYMRHDNVITVHTALLQQRLRVYGNSGSTTVTDANISRFRIGSMYSAYNDFNGGMFALNSQYSYASGAIEYLNGSTYFRNTNLGGLSPTNYNGNHVSTLINDYREFFGTNIYKAGTSGGWMANAASTYGPSGAGGDFITNDQMYAVDHDLYKANWWEQVTISDNRTAGNYMPIKILGVLKCGGTNPRGATNSITFNANINYSNGNYASLLCFETNDYDQKPITLIPNGTDGCCIYAYNETIGGNNVLVIQGSPNPNNTTNIDHYYPLELAVPSHTADSDSLRVKVSLTKSSGAYSYVPYYIIYRRPSSNGGIYSYGNAWNIGSASTDTSSPTDYTFSFTHSSSGVKEMNSVYFAIGFRNNSANSILRIHNAIVEII